MAIIWMQLYRALFIPLYLYFVIIGVNFKKINELTSERTGDLMVKNRISSLVLSILVES